MKPYHDTVLFNIEKRVHSRSTTKVVIRPTQIGSTACRISLEAPLSGGAAVIISATGLPTLKETKTSSDMALKNVKLKPSTVDR
jgi:hypothetical protein